MPYTGYHEPIQRETPLELIHGRDKWNLKMDVVQDILEEVARMFGMEHLPNRYWDADGQLTYALAFPHLR